MRVQIQPLRDVVVVELCAAPEPVPGQLQVIRGLPLVRAARIVACGPAVRDLTPGMTALVNTAAATHLDGYLLVSEATILGTL